MGAHRRTIRREVTASGAALHSGAQISMTLRPAAAGTGVVFRRLDAGGAEIPARYDAVSETRLGTVVTGPGGASAGVVEHLLSAVAGAAIDDLIVELDGPEPPILDGDALCYLALLDAAGSVALDDALEAIAVRRPVRIAEGASSAALLPASRYELSLEIDFATPAIGRQRLDWVFTPEAYRRDIAPARTFGFVRDLDALRQAGLAHGASLDNTLAIADDRVVNASLMRFPDEFVRHKILDAVGDLKLAGRPLIARFEGVRSGHRHNNALLRALFADPANYAVVAAR